MLSEENSESNSSFNEVAKKSVRPSRLRRLGEMNKRSDSRHTDDDNESLKRITRPKKQNIASLKHSEESNSDQEEVEREVVRVLRPAVESIHSRKQSNGNKLYLVRFASKSFLNCDWVEESQLLADEPNLKNKLRRFDSLFDSSAAALEQSNEMLNYDPENVIVDRILSCSEIFMMIHPKKTSEITHKWTESLLRVIRVMINFRFKSLFPGHFYLTLSSRFANFPELVDCVDFSILINRIYMDNYSNPERFWEDLESVFKAVDRLAMYLSEKSDVEELNYKMRQLAARLYSEWLAEVQSQATVFRANLCDGGFAEKLKRMRVVIQGLNDKISSGIKLCEVIDKNKNLLRFRKNGDQEGFSKFEEEVMMLREMLGMSELALGEEICVDDSLVKDEPEKIDYLDVNEDEKQQINNSEKVENGANNKNGIDYNKLNEIDNENLSREKNGVNHQHIDTTDKGMIIESDTNCNHENNCLSGKTLEYHLSVLNYLQSAIDFADSVLAKTFWNNFATQVNNLPKIPRFFQSIDEIDMTESFPSLSSPTELFYLVKWTNMSYADATWELESDLTEYDSKIKDYKRFTRAIDREKRGQYQLRLQAFTELNEILSKDRSLDRTPQSKLTEFRHRVFTYKDPKSVIQYTPKTQPIFKNERTLRSYQLESLNWMIEAWTRRRNVILADEMGLGKTIQAMAFINHLITSEHQPGPYLVIAPLSTLSHWKRVFEDWTHHNCVLYYDAKGKAGRDYCQRFEFYQTDITMKGLFLKENRILKFSVLITSFEVFIQDFETVFINLPFQHIIIDEAHRLKNRHAKIISILKRLVCQRIFLLTGTPIQNNLSELWSLLNFIEPNTFNDLDCFLGEFNSQMKIETIQKLKEELTPFLLRRMKEDVESSIPPLVETIIDVELTSVQKVVYKTIYEKNKGTLQKGLGLSGITLMNNLEMQLRKCCNHPFTINDIVDDLTKECVTNEQYIDKLINCSGKMIFVHKALEKFNKEKKKVLIFSQFTNVLKLLEEYLLFHAIRHYKIDGSTKVKDRQTYIDRFNNSVDCFEVFLLSTKAGGLGINLTTASIVIIFDSDWNPQNDIQAIARAHRIGQTQEVKVFRLISKNTYESEMFERASRKLGLDQAILLTHVNGQKNQEDMKPEETNKLRADEIELLLRKGMVGFLANDNDGDDAQRQFGENIDDIIQNARVAKYSVIKGLYSFSKANFVGDTTEAVLHIDDPDFWKKAFVVQKHAVENLEKEYKGLFASGKIRKLDVQKDFFLRFSEELCKYLSDRVTNEGFSADTEIKFCDLLIQISDNNSFNSVFRELAAKFNADFNKGARRIKKLDEKKLDAMLKARSEGRTGLTRTEDDSEEEGRGGRKRRAQASDNEDSLKKRESLKDDSDVFENEEEKLFYSYRKNKKNKTEEKAKGCDFCGQREGILKCEGPCERLFHEQCLFQNVQALTGLFGERRNECLAEYGWPPEFEPVLFNQENRKCFFCLYQKWYCFSCKVPAGLSAEEYHKLNSKEDSVVVAKKAEDPNNDLLFKCSICPKMFHSKCINIPKLSNEQKEVKDAKNIKKEDMNQEDNRFVCEQHFCSTCKLFSVGMYQCIDCPFASHKKCMSKRNQAIGGFKIRCMKHFQKTEKSKPKEKTEKDNGSQKISRKERKELQEKAALERVVVNESEQPKLKKNEKKKEKTVKEQKKEKTETEKEVKRSETKPQLIKKEIVEKTKKSKTVNDKKTTELKDVEKTNSKKRMDHEPKERLKDKKEKRDRTSASKKKRDKIVESNNKLSIEFFKPFDYSSYKKVN